MIKKRISGIGEKDDLETVGRSIIVIGFSVVYFAASVVGLKAGEGIEIVRFLYSQIRREQKQI